MGWYDKNSGGGTHPVGMKKANAWGLYDMRGNVWEWAQDWKDSYGSLAITDPRGPASGSGRVLRGGSWGDDAQFARSALRHDDSPGYRDGNLGFRLRTSAKRCTTDMCYIKLLPHVFET